MYAAGNPGGPPAQTSWEKNSSPPDYLLMKMFLIFSGDCTAIGMYIYL
jgi:hypothetical protein